MISKVEAEIIDQNSGSSGDVGSGIHVKIGICGNGVSAMQLIRSTMNADDIKGKLGNSPVADACMDSVEWGAPLIYCFPVKITTQAVIGEVKAERVGTSSGTIEVSGSPYNAYNVVIKIEETGGFNSGAYSVSVDGGSSYGEIQTIPLAGTADIAGTGITLAFKEGEGGFDEGDIFKFAVSAPSASNGDLVAAVDSLKNFSENIEFVHIVGETNAALWAALELKAQQFEKDYKRPLLFVVEQRMPDDTETAEAYVEAIKDDAKDVGRHMIIVQSCGKYNRMDGSAQKTNVAGIISGLIAKAKESASIAYVDGFPINSKKLTELYPEGIEDYMEILDTGRYVTLRKHPGKTDWYVTSSNTAAKANSDYAFIEAARVMYRIVREVCKIATGLQNKDYDGSNMEVELKAVESQLSVPIDDAIRDKIISDGTLTILMDEIDSSTEEMPVKVDIAKRGYLRKISMTFSANNPTVTK